MPDMGGAAGRVGYVRPADDALMAGPYPGLLTRPDRHHSEVVHGWGAVMAGARSEWPDRCLDEFLERTVTDITDTVGGRRAAFAWTGAIECVVLAYIAELAGIERCVLAMTELEFPEYLCWVTDRMPDGLSVLSTGQDLPWLARHPQMLFPRDSMHLVHWQRLVQGRARQRYYQDTNLGILLLGGRREGSYAYGPGHELTWRDRHGVLRYTPLADWPAEAMLSLIHRERLPLPPCYGWPRSLGPGPWAARAGTASVFQGFAEVWAIDPDIIRAAAPQLPQAAHWLAVTGRS